MIVCRRCHGRRPIEARWHFRDAVRRCQLCGAFGITVECHCLPLGHCWLEAAS